MKRTFQCCLIVLTLGAPSVVAQAPPQDPSFAEHLFPPELIMQHQRDLRLTDQQRSVITQSIQDLQARVVELQWSMQDESQQLAELLQEASIDEGAALEQIGRVLDLEREVKRAHLQMLIRIKNALTAGQQQRLAELTAGLRND